MEDPDTVDRRTLKTTSLKKIGEYIFNEYKNNPIKTIASTIGILMCISSVLFVISSNFINGSNSPEDTDTLIKNGLAFHSMAKYSDAIRSFNEALEITPNNSTMWDFKGNSLDDLGQYGEALSCFDRAIKIDPNNAWTWMLKGIALSRLDRNEEAIKCTDIALIISPNYANAWLIKGFAFKNLEKYEEAIKAFDTAINLDSSVRSEIARSAWHNKGLALKSLGRTAEADAAFAKAKELGYEG